MGRDSIDFAIGSNRQCRGTLVRRRTSALLRNPSTRPRPPASGAARPERARSDTRFEPELLQHEAVLVWLPSQPPSQSSRSRRSSLLELLVVRAIRLQDEVPQAVLRRRITDGAEQEETAPLPVGCELA